MTNNTTSFAASLTSTAQQRNRRYRNEGNVKLDLSQLIEALGYGPVENEYTILGGSIDIYIPHHCTSSNQSGPMSSFRKSDFLPVIRPRRCV